MKIHYHYNGDVSVGANNSLIFTGGSSCTSTFNAQHQENRNGKNHFHSGNAKEYIKKHAVVGQSRQIFYRHQSSSTCYEDFIVLPAFKTGLILLVVWAALTLIGMAVLFYSCYGRSNQYQQSGQYEHSAAEVRAAPPCKITFFFFQCLFLHVRALSFF